ncbi:WD40 repeat domain-containing protein [Schlesneria paludicola]|uniref:WD40 repeat domain-containing protein n=1 Tax=Schlesneria paludicola TaxID=360056 RepID=UPI00029AF525|nr:WD40 repeat domain-containing protein [Schlesneria paludicola]
MTVIQCISNVVRRRLVFLACVLAPNLALSQQPELRGTYKTFTETKYLQFSPDGKFFAASTGDGTIELHTSADGSEYARCGQASGEDSPIAFSMDSKTLVYGTDNGRLVLWDIEQKKQTRSIDLTVRFTSLAFSPDGMHLAFSQLDKVAVMDWETKKLPPMLETKPGVLHVSFSSDGKLLATANKGKVVRVWDWKAKKAKWTLNCKARVASVCFSPDGKWLAAASDQVQIWDVKTGKEKFTLKGHGKLVGAVTFSSDGKWLASAGEDGTIRLWDTATEKDKFNFKAHDKYVTALAFGPNSDVLASGSFDNTVKLWVIGE